MMLTVNGERKRIAFKGGTIADLLREIGLAREEVLVKVGGKLTPEDARMGAKDRVEIIKVVFGG